MHHSFDINVATQYGVHEAILIHHFQHWIAVNKRLNRNQREGHTWTYQTLAEIAAHFPYLTREEVRELIDRLCNGNSRRSKKEGLEFEPVLIKGNFNRSGFDRTAWYAFIDEEKFTVLAQAKMDDSKNVHERATAQMENGNCPHLYQILKHILKRRLKKSRLRLLPLPRQRRLPKLSSRELENRSQDS